MMKVKIVKATLNTYWYADKIGEVFEVKPSTNNGLDYELVDKGHYILSDDCIVLPDHKNCSGDVTEYMIRNVLTKEQLVDLCVWALKEIDNVRSN